MRKIYIFLLILTGFILSAEVSVVSGFLNDNYTGSTENGINGDYIGADDFLTFTLFVQGSYKRMKEYHYYRVVTSRKYDYRYDLLENGYSYDLYIDEYTFSPTISLLYKGDLGGEGVQNGFHDLRDIPPLVQNYLEEELALALGLKGYYSLEGLLTKSDELNGVLNLSLPWSIKPVSAMLTLDYIIKFPLISINAAVSYKQYINEVEHYSDFVRSGFIYGSQLVLETVKDISINAGFCFFPVQNLNNDPVYEAKSFNYSPQFWVTFGLNGAIHRVMDIVNL